MWIVNIPSYTYFLSRNYLNVATLFWVLNLSSETGWQLMIGSFVHFVLVKNLKMQTGI